MHLTARPGDWEGARFADIMADDSQKGKWGMG